MKLYVWENVLTDYTDGIMFALAANEEEARSLIKDKFLAEEFNPGGLMGHLVTELDTKRAAVFDTPVGFYLKGGG
jgi:hypothetical protein